MYKIKEIPISERPRERFKEVGCNCLSDRELLSIILKTGTKDRNVVDVSTDLLNHFSLDSLGDITINDLTTIKGIGEVKAIELLSAIELGKRIFYKHNTDIKRMESPQKIFEGTRYLFCNLKQEYFYALYFNTKKELIGKKLLFIGTINQSIVHPREIFKTAYKLSASFIVCMHNHPSNDTTPSLADIDLTDKLVKIGKIQGIYVIDHIIVGSDNYYSFFEHGDMKGE